MITIPKDTKEDYTNEYRWVDKYSGYDCLIRRNKDFGTLCGYVKIPDELEHVPEDELERNLLAHGGITFCGKHPRSDKIWVGFDCNHVYDRGPDWFEADPAMSYLYTDPSTYKDMSYTFSECVWLAKQVKDFKKDKMKRLLGVQVKNET